MFLIVIYALTKWVEVITFNNAPTSATTIEAFKQIFTIHGIPHYLVTDNVTIFKSDLFTNFCNHSSIKQMFSAPGYPATNGKAERTVQTFKYKLKAMLQTDKNINIEEMVRKFVFKYRTTPLANGKSPAELHFGRPIRNILSTLKPVHEFTNNQELKSFREFAPGQRVLSRNYRVHKKWLLGRIWHKLGKLHYEVILDNGYKYKGTLIN